jgi:hypothetical protein
LLFVLSFGGHRKDLNTGQGLGFRVFSTVVDKKTLNKTGLAVMSTFATLVPIVLALQPELPEITGEDAPECAALSVAQQDALRCVCVLFAVLLWPD